jgi:hypothetical protein
MLNPDDGPPLPEILNHKWAPIKLKRLIVAYHQPSNLGDLLRPRTMELESGLPVSALCDEMEEARQQQQQQQQPPTTTTANNRQQQQQQQNDDPPTPPPVRLYSIFAPRPR